jgi:membrane-anchored protein YejM (alkaline phosphatase superfamily)
LVAKLEWYIFHALAIDFMWLFVFNLLFVFAYKYFNKSQRLLEFYIVLHGLVMCLTVFDHEIMRFMGGHLSLTLFNTYGNAASGRELFNFLAQDASIPFLPLVLLFGVFPAWYFCWKRYHNYFVDKGLKPLWISLFCLVLFWTFKNYIWKGSFREQRLKPVIFVIWDEFVANNERSFPESAIQRLTKEHRDMWHNTQMDSLWVFPIDSLPFYREPLHKYCLTHNLERCNHDGDNDGFILLQDCNDWDASINPQSVDIPGNGVDEDCSGLDEKPVNMVFFMLESHRAVNAGFLKHRGAKRDATPFLNKIAKNGKSWDRITVGGLPTIGAFISSHLGLLETAKKHIGTDFPELYAKSFVQALKENGYYTHFFSAADPSWDNQTPWINKWYNALTYDRKRETDRSMYRHMGQWMLDSLGGKQPFFLSSMTKTNHYPFNGTSEVDFPDFPDLNVKMANTMKYTEKAMEELMLAIEKASWYKNTLFFFMADHGFALGEHEEGGVVGGIYKENSWVPFLVFGKHPQLLDSLAFSQASSQIDIAPTILDLAGIRSANSFMGHSLLKGERPNKKAYLLRSNQRLVVSDSLRFYCDSYSKRPNGLEVFHDFKDPNEAENIFNETVKAHSRACLDAARIDSLLSYAVESNRVFPRD